MATLTAIPIHINLFVTLRKGENKTNRRLNSTRLALYSDARTGEIVEHFTTMTLQLSNTYINLNVRLTIKICTFNYSVTG